MRGPARRGRQKIGVLSSNKIFRKVVPHTQPFLPSFGVQRKRRKEKRKEQKIAPPTSKRERESAQKNTEKEKGEEKGRRERESAFIAIFCGHYFRNRRWPVHSRREGGEGEKIVVRGGGGGEEASRFNSPNGLYTRFQKGGGGGGGGAH